MEVLWNKVVDMPDQFNMTHLLTYLSDLHRERLERILATCLLYCSRYQDTRVIMIKQQPQCRMMIINLDNIPGSDPPVGHTPAGEACSSLAILYHWSCPRSVVTTNVSQHQTSPGPASRGRKISASLALEKKMLSIVDVFAVLPSPNAATDDESDNNDIVGDSSCI